MKYTKYTKYLNVLRPTHVRGAFVYFVVPFT